ncbi:MAG TPA: FtsX-like permease family protein [Candidatus Latescibacteria bacterium]|nr:FtsX-like permease family protein [Candidatus Latescibacterota bacterium]HOS65136.1 FtsX-like permease family protein [Candidatus Latescibacterota bacterium]HPK74288.1 FtsX-like permease family protein [Candidatus Latescibacterota bacterium]
MAEVPQTSGDVPANGNGVNSSLWRLLGKIGKWLLIVFAVAQLLAVTVFDPEKVSVWLFGLDLNPHRTTRADFGRVDAESQAVMDAVTRDNVARHMAAIVTGESRAVGYPGERKTFEYVRSEFQRLGLRDMGVDSFEVVVPRDEGGSVTFGGGETKPIYALWPNQVKTPTLPRAQISLNDTLLGPVSAVFPSKPSTFELPPEGVAAEFVTIPRHDLSLTPEEQERFGARRGQVGIWDVVDFSRHQVRGKIVVFDLIGSAAKAKGSSETINIDSANVMGARAAGARGVVFRDYQVTVLLNPERRLPELPDDILYFSADNQIAARLKDKNGNSSGVLRFTPGIGGELLYAGSGDFHSFNGRKVEGSIVVMDFSTQKNYLNAHELGAQAIIFVDDGKITREEAEAKFHLVPVDVARFWAEGACADTLRQLGSQPGNRVVLRSRMQWSPVRTYNIWGRIPGTRTNRPEDTIVLEAYYDANSVVPARAMGAENAAGIAGLLAIAESFSQHPPELPILFLATSGHHSALSGINEWLYRHSRTENAFLQRIPKNQRIPFGLFIGLDLSSQNDQVGSFAQGTFYTGWNTDARRTNMHTGYGKAFMRYAEELFPGQQVNEAYPQFVDGIAPAKRTWRTFLPVAMAFDHEPVNYVGLSAITLATTNDIRERVDTPVDSLGAVNIDNVATQARTIAGLIHRGARDEGFFQETKIKPKDTQRELTGRILQFDRRKSFIPSTQIGGAIVTTSYGNVKSFCGVRGMLATLTNSGPDDGLDCTRWTLTDTVATNQIPSQVGRFRFHMVGPHVPEVMIKAYEIGDDGRIVMAPDLGQEGDKTYPMRVRADSPLLQTLQVLFEARALSLFEIIDSRYLSALDMMSVRGPDGSELRSYGMEVVPLQSRSEGKVESGAVAFAQPGTRVKVLMSTSLFGIKYLLINAPDEFFTNPLKPSEVTPAHQIRAEGSGYPVDLGRIDRTSWRVARDIWVIDDVRMKTLTRFGIVNQRVMKLHEDAREALLQAKQAYDKQEYDGFIAMSRRAWGYEARAYPDVKGTAIDTIQGVIFYFALLLPFAFFMERLVIGAVDIRRQILGFGLIFVGIFFVLQFVHPAFKLSTSPYIIFLGFVIFALGTIVTVIVVGKFNWELKRMKMAASGMHETDVGRLQATAAAIALGINNLRKRPMRTGLTAVTIAILTFSVLSFTSVVTELKFYKIKRDNPPAYDGMLVRDRNWFGLQESVLDYVQTAFRGKALITPRSWYMAQMKADKAFIDFRNPANDKRSFASGILGVEADEAKVTALDKALVAGRWFAPGERGVCILPSRMAELAGVTAADVGTAKLEMLGRVWTVIGLVDEQGISRRPDLDAEILTPVDLVAEQQRQTEASAEDPTQMAEAPIQTFTHIAPENVLILPHVDVMEMGGMLRSVAVSNFAEPHEMLSQIEGFMSRVALTTFVGHDNKVEVYSSLGATSLKGLSNLGVPIVVAALIVLNTMLGAVYDRKREIGIFATIGLTPFHIAALFIAEACVFAVIGAVWGYLIGQVLAIALSQTSLLAGMSLNYSSLSAVASTLIVMATVVLSSLYPAKVAADSAVPDVTRRWSFPPADGDYWRFDFPFTVGESDVIGLYAYLQRVLEAYGAGSAGEFVAQNVELEALEVKEGEDPQYRLSFRTWLAPYDLGISQDVQMDAVPTGEYRIYRIEMTIHRLSGDVDSWQRINRGFMNVMRKRFLVWRTIPPALKDEYRERGKRIFRGETVGSTVNVDG